MHIARGDGVTGIKRRRRDLSGDGVRNLATASGRGRLKKGSRIIYMATASGLQSDAGVVKLLVSFQQLQQVFGVVAWGIVRQKEWDKPFKAITKQELASLRASAYELFGNEKFWFEIPRCIAWDKVDNPSPQSTLQVLTSFKVYTPSVTYLKEVEETLGTPIEMEHLDQMKIKDVGLDIYNHDIPFISREVPSFGEPKPQPQLLPSCPSLDECLRKERGHNPPTKPHSLDSLRMKVVDNLTIYKPPSPHLAQKEWDKPFKAITKQELASLRASTYELFGNEKFWFEIPRCIAWDKVDNLSPQSTLQVLTSFKVYTQSVTYSEEIEETLGTPIEMEHLDQMKIKDVGLDIYNHDIPFISRKVPSFDEPKPQPQLLPSCPSLYECLRKERGHNPPTKPHSLDSLRMK
nr:ribonuclease H-like domain-containing protein [Tanacetum cinerariifolium]